jgi:lipoyl(octanoyl) transferase
VTLLIPFAAWQSTFSFQRRLLARDFALGCINLKPDVNVTQKQKTCWIVHLGLAPYDSACDFQQKMVEARKQGAIPDVLLLCEHPHVVTLGRNGRREHLRASDHLLAQMNVEFHLSDRGGDITYHGPGQVVGYPILDLTEHRRDVRWYVNQLEEVMIRATAEFGLVAKRVEGQHGIWLDTEPPVAEEKLGALGVHLSRWVTSHGFAYNVSTDLRYFDFIVPCGILGKRATSLERALGRAVSAEEVEGLLAANFGTVFERNMISVSSRGLQDTLANFKSSTVMNVLDRSNVLVGVAKGSEV